MLQAAGGIDSKHQTVQGVAFPVSDDVINALCDMKDARINYVQMVNLINSIKWMHMLLCRKKLHRIEMLVAL